MKAAKHRNGQKYCVWGCKFNKKCLKNFKWMVFNDLISGYDGEDISLKAVL